MKWIGITGTWRNVDARVEHDVRTAAREVIDRGDGIVAGGAPGVDFFATHEALLCDPTARAIRLVLPATLETYAQQYRVRRSPGTTNTIDHARTTGKLVTVADYD